jgi:NAD+ synthase (glutamine-hydrolysing)
MQSTQAKIGPYPLQDFNLHYLVRWGFRPSKILFLAWSAWRDPAKGAWPPNISQADRRAYSYEEIRRWLFVFLERFFASQFKRSAVPNGPKLTSAGSLSPRGDWRAPSDAKAETWVAELRTNSPEHL